MEPTLLQEDYQGNKAAPFDFKNIPGFDLETYGRERIARMIERPAIPESKTPQFASYVSGHGWEVSPPVQVEGIDYFIDPINRSIVVKGPGEYIGMPRLCSEYAWLDENLKAIPGKVCLSEFMCPEDREPRHWDAFGNEVTA
jgi:hypothetical protein